MTLGRLLSFSVWESGWESLQGPPPTRSVNFIPSPRDSSRRGHLSPLPHMAQPCAWPAVVTERVHSKCAVNLSEKVTGWTQWRHCF